MIDEKILKHILIEMDGTLFEMINEFMIFPHATTRKILESKIAKMKFYIEWIRVEIEESTK